GCIFPIRIISGRRPRIRGGRAAPGSSAAGASSTSLSENAAEFGVFSPLGHIDPGTWTEVMDLNQTTNWRPIRAVDPLLRAAPPGRAIFVTSGVANGFLIEPWTVSTFEQSAQRSSA